MLANHKIAFFPMKGATNNLLNFLLLFFLSILVFQIHELGHFTLGKICGLDLLYEYSHVKTVSNPTSQTQRLFFALGGPFFTYAFALSSLFWSYAE